LWPVDVMRVLPGVFWINARPIDVIAFSHRLTSCASFSASIAHGCIAFDNRANSLIALSAMARLIRTVGAVARNVTRAIANNPGLSCAL